MPMNSCNGVTYRFPQNQKYKPFQQTKLWLPIFWDKRCILLVDIMPLGKTIITTDAHCEILRHLRWTIHNQRRGVLKWDVLYLYLLHIPDLSPSDFHLFLHLNLFR